MLVGSGDGEDVSVYGESLGAQALVGESGVAERLRRAAADLKLREGSGVRSLTLFSCGLSSLHGLPVELGSTIMSLNLSSNEIGPSLVLLPELGLLTRLVRLDLSSNRVERLTPPAQPASKTATGDGLLPALRQLCVAHNRIASLEVRSNHTSRHHPPPVQTLSQRWKLPAAANCLGRSVMRALCSQQTHTFQSERTVVRVSIISLISLSPSLSLSWRHARLCSVLRALWRRVSIGSRLSSYRSTRATTGCEPRPTAAPPLPFRCGHSRASPNSRFSTTRQRWGWERAGQQRGQRG